MPFQKLHGSVLQRRNHLTGMITAAKKRFGSEFLSLNQVGGKECSRSDTQCEVDANVLAKYFSSIMTGIPEPRTNHS